MYKAFRFIGSGLSILLFLTVIHMTVDAAEKSKLQMISKKLIKHDNDKSTNVLFSSEKIFPVSSYSDQNDYHFGYSISSDDNRVLIGARGAKNQNGVMTGAAYVFERFEETWIQTAEIFPDDGSEEDRFARKVYLDGDRALISSVYDDDHGKNSGAVYVFDLVNGVWQQTAKLTADDATANDEFGISIQLSGDEIMVGAWLDDFGNKKDAGAVYVFNLIAGQWLQTAKLQANDADSGDGFGLNISLKPDRLVVSAFLDDDKGNNAGAVYVFEYDGSHQWKQTAKITANDAAENDRFGIDMSILGEKILIGSFGDDNDAGSAYLFEKVNERWIQQSKLIASDRKTGDRFSSVLLTDEWILIGAYSGDNGYDCDCDAGSAYVFKKIKNQWQQIAKLRASDGGDQDFFGLSQDIHDQHIMIGAFNDDRNKSKNAGSVYIFNTFFLESLAK